MSAQWLAKTLRDAGLKVEEAPRWTVRGGTGFAPKGVMIHHTATGQNWSKERLTKLLIEGRPDLKGPLCHLQLERDGTFVVIAAGKANHAGAGRWENITNGNSTFIGIEAANDGVGEPWPQVQIEAMGRATAAMLRVMQTSPGMVVGHKEWAPKRKIDPRGVDMDMFRRYVTNILNGSQPVTQPSNEINFPSSLKRGDKGEWVKRLQGLLYAWAFLSMTANTDAKGFPDGMFGPSVDTAVRAAQVRFGLPATGVADPVLWRRLFG